MSEKRAPRKISAAELAADIRKGTSNADLMRK
jgi:hypothetical protein